MTIDDLQARVEAGADSAHQRVLERMVDKLFEELEQVNVWQGTLENDYLPQVMLQPCNCPSCQGRGQECTCSYCRARVRYTAIKIRLHQIEKHLRGGYWDEPSPETKTLFGARLRHWQDRAYEERMIMEQWNNRCSFTMFGGSSGTGGTVNIRSSPWFNPNPTLTIDSATKFYVDDTLPNARFGPTGC